MVLPGVTVGLLPVTVQRVGSGGPFGRNCRYDIVEN